MAVASTNGFSIPAQNYAATYRIPLIDFSGLDIMSEYTRILSDARQNDNDIDDDYDHDDYDHDDYDHDDYDYDDTVVNEVKNYAEKRGESIALAITNSGQMMLLYGERPFYHIEEELYSLSWEDLDKPWMMSVGGETFWFQLPKTIKKKWIEQTCFDARLRGHFHAERMAALGVKEQYISGMTVLYINGRGRAVVRNLSIDMHSLEEARARLGIRLQDNQNK